MLELRLLLRIQLLAVMHAEMAAHGRFERARLPCEVGEGLAQHPHLRVLLLQLGNKVLRAVTELQHKSSSTRDDAACTFSATACSATPACHWYVPPNWAR